MPKLKPDALPSYRLHKQSGQAIVSLSGRDILPGPHGTNASRAACDRAVTEWISNGRPGQEADLSVGELILRFWEFAENYFGKDSGELSNFRYALRPARMPGGKRRESVRSTWRSRRPRKRPEQTLCCPSEHPPIVG